VADGDGGTNERTGDNGQERPSTPRPTGRWRRPGGIAVAAVAVGALVAGIAVSQSDDGGDASTSAATRDPQSTTTRDRSASEATGGATTTEQAAATTERDAAGSGNGANPTTTAIATASTSTTLPGVIDPGDPHAVTQAVVDLGTAGVVPAEAAAYLEGGDERIATEFFMFTAEGIAASRVGDCTTTATGGPDSSLCTAAIETSYGARAHAEFTLYRADAGARWHISQIRMIPD
jgi:hypothetical protein